MPVISGTTSADVKPPGGKLLRCTLTMEEGILVSIRFTGDFFLIPGEEVARLEQTLTGLEAEEIERAIHSFFSTAQVDMMGVTPEHFVKVVRMALAHLY